MTCPESEALMGEGEISTALEEHLTGCAGCRTLWDDLEANRHVLRAMGLEVLPTAPVQIRLAYPWWKWTSAAAALILTLGAAWWVSRPPKPPSIASIDVTVTGIVEPVPVEPAKVPVAIKPAILPVAHKEPLKVKMLTPDPDVVIYWLID